jgi:hypothetical protein
MTSDALRIAYARVGPRAVRASARGTPRTGDWLHFPITAFRVGVDQRKNSASRKAIRS